MKGFIAPLLLLTPLSVVAFEYRVGVGKSEVTGQNGLGFDPSSIRPTGGDHIVFEFRAGSHSAVQTTFENPCQPMAGGYDSGVFIVPDGTEVDAPGLPSSVFNVSSTDPLWFYDGASGQCHLGAVFSVNPALSGDQTAANFLQAAMNTQAQAPTTTIPASTSAAPSSQQGASSSTGSGTSQTSTTSQASATANSASAYSKNAGSVAGIALIALAGAIAVM